MSKILIIPELRENKYKKVSFEVASEGKRLAEKLGGSVSALVIGHNIEKIAEELGEYGVPEIYIIDDEKTKNSYLQLYAAVIEKVAKDISAEYILLPATVIGKSLSGLIASKFETSALTDCTSLIIENNELKVQRPVYAGKTIITVSVNKKPVIITLRPNVFPIVQNKVKPEIKKVDFKIDESLLISKIIEIKESKGKKIDLTEASIIVSGGRGMKGPENFKLIEELADLLGGAVGSSRAVVDAGWRPHEEQVGQTGKTVSPQLYIACGISGAIQHLAGMRTSKVIVAINKDPEAPIFQIADYGIVGDVMEVLPKMIEEAKKLKS